MSDKKNDIIKIKNGDINDANLKNSIITRLLKPSLIFVNEEKNTIDKNYSFLELDEDIGIIKFHKSLQYFEILKDDFIQKEFNVESDNLIEIISPELFVLQVISEFANYNFDYGNQKNHYKKFLEDNDLSLLNEKINILNNYLNSISKFFDLLDINTFDLVDGLNKSLDFYKNKMIDYKLSISEKLFGKAFQLQELIKKTKILIIENNKELFNKIKILELDFYNNNFLEQSDFITFLYLINQEIKRLFSEIVYELIENIKWLWNKKIENDKIKSNVIEKENQEKQKNDNLNLDTNTFDNKIKDDDFEIIDFDDNDDGSTKEIDNLINEIYKDFDEKKDDDEY